MVRLIIPFALFCLFLTLGIWVGFLSTRPASPEDVARKVGKKINRELERVDEEATKIIAAIGEDGTLGQTSGECTFLLYTEDTLRSWSGNSIVPPSPLVTDTFTLKLVKTSGGEYLAKKWQLDPHRYVLGLVPLHRQFTIRNSYLQPEWNKKIFSEGDITISEPNDSKGTPVCIRGECVFSIVISRDSLSAHENTRWTATGLITVAILFLIVAIARLIAQMRSKSSDFAFLILLVSLWLIREGMTVLDFPGRFIHVPLFDAQFFASSSFNRSLGDLLLNIVTLATVCYYLFRNYYQFDILQFLDRHPLIKRISSILCSLIFFLAFLFPFVVIQTIYNNSSIVLDISQSLDFDTLRVIAVVIVLLSWVCSFLFAHVFLRLLIASSSRYHTFLNFLLGVVLFILINIFSGQQYLSTLLVGSVYFLIVFGLSFYRKLRKVSYITFAYLFTALIAYAVLSTISIQHFTRKEKEENQFRFAHNFIIDRDYFAEYLLHEVGHKISSDIFIQSRISSPFLSKEAIRQKVRQVFVPSYFNKYDVDVLLFGAGGNPLNNSYPTPFAELINSYNKETAQTEYDGVYFVNSPTGDVTQRYLVVSPIVRSGITSGYVVLELLLKRVIPESVYPELLIDSRFQQFYKTHDISYAVYGKDILYTAGSYNYEQQFRREYLGDPRIHLKGIVHDDYVHVAVEDENNRVAVVSAPVTPPVYVMANFSFLLVLGLSLLLIFVLIQGLVTLIQGRTLFYSARIQLVLNLAFFLPLIIVSATTLRLATTTSRQQLNEEYLNKSKSFGRQLESVLDESMNNEDVNRIDFENQLADMAHLFNVDANVYLPNGYLLASTQRTIFESGLIAPYINAEAFQKIKNGQGNLIATEKIGNLNYNVSFATLKSSKSGKVIGILALPFFQSQSSLAAIQVRILANILNVFAVIFIALIILSYIVSEWLTFPLKFITRSLSRTTLTRNNEPLTWGAQDEIGLMVKEYNQMLYKLSESKAELEQTHRERAWREMAQQVAHEIKNPLTPMKLTLQQLERSLGNDAVSKEKATKALTSLLSQVEILNDIASSFSTFARMPEPDIKRIELISLLKRAVDLHHHSGTIQFRSKAREIYAMGDDQLLGRIFSNIILNAFQAAKPGTALLLEISVENENGVSRITFHDNGKGIDEKVAERVFIPHFSTKRSGSGLGLAIAKQGIEHMKGRIWFESKVGEGTFFYIELPVVNSVS
ncbi:MAG TPA: HAMP domain-containing sensor histidine kinase [Cyclobacteriaceae bacterium]|nr:HAMP domain-containing sensor histidine kinase [Cyclobacteriaceae bacterium]